MRISKRIVSLAVAALLLLSLVSCGASNNPTESGTGTNKNNSTVKNK